MGVYADETEVETLVRLGGAGLSRRALLGLGSAGGVLSVAAGAWFLARRSRLDPATGSNSDPTTDPIDTGNATGSTTPTMVASADLPGVTVPDVSADGSGAPTEVPSTPRVTGFGPILPNDQGWALWGMPQRAFAGVPEGSWRIDLATGEVQATEPSLRWGILHVDRARDGEFRILSRGHLEAPVRRSWVSPDESIWVSRVGVDWVEHLGSGGGTFFVVDRLDLPEASTMIGVDEAGEVIVSAPDGGVFRRAPEGYAPYGTGRIDEVASGARIETICDVAGLCTETLILSGGSTARPLTTAPSMAPRFSPDGQWVVRLTLDSNLVVEGFETEATTIMRVDASSQLPQLLWTPDSKVLLVITTQGIVTVGVDGDVRTFRSPFGGGAAHWFEAIGIA